MKKIIVILFVAICSYTAAKAQTADKPAEYPGGVEKFQTYFSNKLALFASKNKFQFVGILTAKFTVDSIGKVIKPIIIEKIPQELNEEAKSLLKRSPKWVPAVKDGKPVSTDIEMAFPFGNP